MAFDEPGDEERPETTPPLPPEDRLWRHPSELAGGVPVPASWPASPPPGRGSRPVAVLAGAGLATVLVIAGVMWFTRPGDGSDEDRPLAAASATTAVFTPAAAPSTAVADRLGPALVQVEAEVGGEARTGTGIRLDGDGTIAVATPVVDDAGTVEVTGHDGERTRAVVVGADPATGITVLRIDAGGTALAARAETATAGEPVTVISASIAPDRSVVTASVEAVGVRTEVDPLVLHDALQLDRSVPAAATGGIVVDADGRVVGIVLAASGTGDGAVAVPATEAIEAARAVRDDGSVRRAWLGVRAVDLSPEAAELMDVDGGAQLTSVQAGSPAAAAGFRKGDVITEVDDQPIGDASDLVVALREWKPGEQVSVTWHRGTGSDRTDVTLGG